MDLSNLDFLCKGLGERFAGFNGLVGGLRACKR